MDKSKKTAYDIEYARTHVKQVKFNLNLETDADIITHLAAQPNQQGYIKSLIRNDITKNEEEKKMKKSEVIAAHATAIESEMVRCYRTVLESAGRIQYSLYIWSDGEVMAHEEIQGDNVTVRPGESESRELYYVLTVAAPCVDVFDLAGMDRLPEDGAEADAAEKEAIDWLVDQYASEGAGEQLDSAIRDAEMEEY